MSKSFTEVIKNRHSYYNLSKQSLISDKEIEEILDFALTYTPSAYNSQSTRLVLLLGENHTNLWNIVLETLKKTVIADKIPATETKIQSFSNAYGSVLFFEDQTVIKGLQEKFPSYKDVFPVWSQHTAAMHQLVVWSMIEDVGFGASLQHYNPLIDDEVAETWKLSKEWKLTAQMPFGVPIGNQLQEKIRKPLHERKLVFK